MSKSSCAKETIFAQCDFSETGKPLLGFHPETYFINSLFHSEIVNCILGIRGLVHTH